MTLVNKIIQVSGAQFHNTSSVHYIVCSPTQWSLLPSPFTFLIPSSTSTHTLFPGNHPVVHIHTFFILSLLLNPSTHTPRPPTLPNNCQPALYLWVCHYFACKFILFIRLNIFVKLYLKVTYLLFLWKSLIVYVLNLLEDKYIIVQNYGREGKSSAWYMK